MKRMRTSAVKALAALAIAVSLLPAQAVAGDLDGLKEVKAVWDLRIEDEALFENRLYLVQQTADILRRERIRPVFVVAVNGKAVKFAVKALKGTAAEQEKLELLPDIQDLMAEMKKQGMRFEICGVSMEGNRVSRSNVLPMFDVQENIWVNIVALQNKGYAYMPLH